VTPRPRFGKDPGQIGVLPNDDAMNDESQFPEAELARLADGSLPARRQAKLRAELKRSPELARALSEQERAVALLRSVDVPASDSLRLRIQEQAETATTRRRRPRLRFGWALPAATGLAVLAAAVILLVGGGGSSGPSLQQTARLALAAATYPAPSEAPGTAAVLDAGAAGIRFPYWERSVDWRAVGARADRISGRSIVTVFYSSRYGDRVGYSIVGGAPVPVSGGVRVMRDRIGFTLVSEGPAKVVTWLRSGHTCVIAGQGVSDRTLLALATADTPQ
jgi:anti-sigma factor RsiW